MMFGGNGKLGGAVLASLVLIMGGSSSALSKGDSPIVKAADAYGNAAKKIAEERSKNLLKDDRKNARGQYLERNLQGFLIRAAYPGGKFGSTAAAPAATEFLCWPQLDHKRKSDANAFVGVIGTRVKKIAKPSGATGLNLFLSELAADRPAPEEECEQKSRRRGEPECKPKPESASFEMSESMKTAVSRASGYNANALTDTEDEFGLCSYRIAGATFTTQEEYLKDMSPELRKVCQCSELSEEAVKYFQPAFYETKASDETSLATGAEVVLGIFKSIDKIAGIFGGRMQEARIKKNVHAYLTKDETRKSFESGVKLLSLGLDNKRENRVIKQGREYWWAYCDYEVAYVAYAGLLRPDREDVSEICKSMQGQKDLLAAVNKPKKAGKPKDLSPEELVMHRKAKAHFATKSAIDKVLLTTAKFDIAFDDEGGLGVKRLLVLYDKMLKASDPKNRNSGSMLMAIIDEARWIAQAIIDVDKELTKIDKEIEKLDKKPKGK